MSYNICTLHYNYTIIINNYCYFHASGCPLLQPFPDYKNTQAGVSSKSKWRTKGNKGDLSTVPSTRGSWWCPSQILVPLDHFDHSRTSAQNCSRGAQRSHHHPPGHVHQHRWGRQHAPARSCDAAQVSSSYPESHRVLMVLNLERCGCGIQQPPTSQLNGDASETANILIPSLYHIALQHWLWQLN